MDIKCHIFRHLPTHMTLSSPHGNGYSAGFACWRCGIRLGWDGSSGFSELRDYKTGLPELVSLVAFTHAKSQRLIKGKHWYSVTDEDEEKFQAKGIITMGPIHPDDLPPWLKHQGK